MPVLRQATFDSKNQIPIANNLSYKTSQFERTDTDIRMILLKHGKRPSDCWDMLVLRWRYRPLSISNIHWYVMDQSLFDGRPLSAAAAAWSRSTCLLTYWLTSLMDPDPAAARIFNSPLPYLPLTNLTNRSSKRWRLLLLLSMSGGWHGHLQDVVERIEEVICLLVSVERVQLPLKLIWVLVPAG